MNENSENLKTAFKNLTVESIARHNIKNQAFV